MVRQNAARYTTVGGNINFAIEQREDGVALSVLDNGIGIDIDVGIHIDSHLLSNVFHDCTDRIRQTI